MADTLGFVVNIGTVFDLLGKVTVLCSTYCSGVKTAPRDVRRIVNEASAFGKTLSDIEKLPRGPGRTKIETSHHIKEGQEQICTLINKILPGTTGIGRIKWPLQKQEVDDILNSLERCRAAISLDLQTHQTTLLTDVHQEIVFQKLCTVEGATYNVYSPDNDAKCYPGTRVNVLDEIRTWAASEHGENIFWLCGMAGTGKSTISRTVAQEFVERGILGASFFFKRGEGDRGRAIFFFPTIVAQLIRYLPSLAQHVCVEVEADPAIHQRSLHIQFDKLIANPLRKLPAPPRPSTIIIVIDALDECDKVEDIKLILRLLSQLKHVASIFLRVFITSRPDLPVNIGFGDIHGEYQDFILHEVPASVIEHDIGIYLEHELAMIRDNYNKHISSARRLDPGWPGPGQTRQLVHMAVPLFIFAATICRFVNGRQLGGPKDMLARVLESQERLSSDLDTYIPVVDQLFKGLRESEKQEVTKSFQNIVGSIVLLAEPLSTSSLARLLKIHIDTIEDRLDFFHSVLRIPSGRQEPVRLFHLSFREFLVDPEKAKQQDKYPFWVDERQTHRALTLNCLRLMDGLDQDICQLKAPGTRRSTIDPQRLNSYLPPELQYACRYWVHHVQEGKDSGASDKVYGFLSRHFLHWVEALSLMDRVWETIGLIRTLQSFYKGRGTGPLCEFLDDAERFILAYSSAIDETPLQLYSSLLIFTPETSKVRTAFNGQVARWILVKPHVEKSWSPALQTLEGRERGLGSAVWSAVFSPNGSLIASASSYDTVRLWRADTGECTHTLNGHTSAVRSAVFSPDNGSIASASRDCTVRLWRADTGECTHTLKGHTSRVKSAVFSPDGRLIASASHDRTIRLWRADTGEYMHALQGHTNSINSAVFSPNGSLIASASYDRTIRLWRVDTGECMHALQSHAGSVNSAVFSPNRELIASASYDYTIRLWLTNTGKCMQTLKGHTKMVMSAVFSPNSRLIASASSDFTVRLWRANTGECTHTLKGHFAWVTSAVFSPDSGLIASAARDCTVRLWRTDTGKCVQRDDLGCETRRLDFGRCGTCLFTDIGAILIHTGDHGGPSLHLQPRNLAASRPGLGISQDHDWITWDGDNILWLPKDARPLCSAVFTSTVLLHVGFGRVVVIGFSLDGLSKLHLSHS